MLTNWERKITLKLNYTISKLLILMMLIGSDSFKFLINQSITRVETAIVMYKILTNFTLILITNFPLVVWEWGKAIWNNGLNVEGNRAGQMRGMILHKLVCQKQLKLPDLLLIRLSRSCTPTENQNCNKTVVLLDGSRFIFFAISIFGDTLSGKK